MVSSSSLKMKMTRITTIINTTTKLRRMLGSSVLHRMKNKITAIILAIKKEEPILLTKVASATTINKPTQMKTMTTPTVVETTPKTVPSTSTPRQPMRMVEQTQVSALNAQPAGGSSTSRR